MKTLVLFAICLFEFFNLSATDYHIGPGQTYSGLNDFHSAIGWHNLQSGDKVYIHWRSTPYNEFMYISTSNVEIVGVPNGNLLPVIDGQNAVQPEFAWQDKGNFYTDTDDDNDPNPTDNNHYNYYNGGLYQYGLIGVGRPYGSGYNEWVENITISNLEVRNAEQAYSFTPWFSGHVSASQAFASVWNAPTRNYPSFMTGIRVQFAKNLTIRNCTIHNCGNGIFVNSKLDDNDFSGTVTAPDGIQVSKNITIEYCKLYDNGSSDSYCHNIYSEAAGTIYQYNYIGRARAGINTSTCLKDRGAGTIVRNNYFDGGGQGHILDLVEAEASAVDMINEPDYHNTYVYGNIMVNPADGATTLIHYGGDHCDYSIFRRGNLYFYNNTLINQADQLERWRTILFFLPKSEYFGAPPCSPVPSSIDEKIIATNNIFYNVASAAGNALSDFYLISTDINSNSIFTNNYISSGYENGFSGYWDNITGQYAPFTGTVTMNNLVSPAVNNPGFKDFNNGDFTLTSGSVNIDAGNNAANPSVNSVNREYVSPQNYKSRVILGSAIDIGAYEYISSVLPLTLISFTAEKQENDVLLKWQTTEEINTDYFSVEWSSDAVHFSEKAKPGTINGRGVNYYEWKHSNAAANTYNYYRLKIVDKDGHYVYSETRRISFNNEGIELYPNPVGDNLTIVFDGAQKGITNFQLFNNDGKLIRQQSKILQQGRQVIIEDYRQLPSGIYFIKISNNNIVTTKRLIKK